jgi:hypothetical protein
MTTVATPGLPSDLGGTIIQANALNLPAGTEYDRVDSIDIVKRVRELGYKLPDFPQNAANDPTWNFFQRIDMAAADTMSATIVGVHVRKQSLERFVKDPSTGRDLTYVARKLLVDVHTWHFATVTLTGGGVYPDALHSIAGATILIDPETSAIIVITNQYQFTYEALSLLLKPVAAGAPLWTPAYASLIGRNPNL